MYIIYTYTIVYVLYIYIMVQSYNTIRDTKLAKREFCEDIAQNSTSCQFYISYIDQ